MSITQIGTKSIPEKIKLTLAGNRSWAGRNTNNVSGSVIRKKRGNDFNWSNLALLKNQTFDLTITFSQFFETKNKAGAFTNTNKIWYGNQSSNFLYDADYSYQGKWNEKLCGLQSRTFVEKNIPLFYPAGSVYSQDVYFLGCYPGFSNSSVVTNDCTVKGNEYFVVSMFAKIDLSGVLN